MWKDRVKKGLNKVGGKVTGKGKSETQQRNQGKRDGGKGDAKSKEPCHNWSRGNGFCKYADACRFSHDGPQGGQGKEPFAKRKGDAVFLATKKGKKARKQLTSLLLKDLKEEKKGKVSSGDSDKEDDEHLYQLIRGVPTVVIKSLDPEVDDFVPSRKTDGQDDDSKVVDKSGGEHGTVFTVTLMMTGPTEDEDDIYAPSREVLENETVVNSLQEDESETNNNNGRVISLESTNKNEDSEFFGHKPAILDASEMISALKWKRRAQRAERLVVDLVDENYRRKTRRVAREGARPDLGEQLRLVTDNVPPLDKIHGDPAPQQKHELVQCRFR